MYPVWCSNRIGDVCRKLIGPYQHEATRRGSKFVYVAFISSMLYVRNFGVQAFSNVMCHMHVNAVSCSFNFLIILSENV